MSYDLAVYVSEALDLDALTALVDASPGLQLEESIDTDSVRPQFLRLLRGKKAAYCCTLESPYDVEADDIPQEVTAAVLGTGSMYSILVEGSDPVAIPHAIRFAKRLAKDQHPPSSPTRKRDHSRLGGSALVPPHGRNTR